MNYGTDADLIDTIIDIEERKLIVTEYEETEVDRDEMPEEWFTVVVTIRSRVDGYTIRKAQNILFLSEREAQEFHAEFGDVWDEMGFDVVNVMFPRYAQVPF